MIEGVYLITEHMEWGEWTSWDCQVSCGKGWAFRTRDCNNLSYNPDPDCETGCEGKDKEEQSCDKGCCSDSKKHFQIF